MSIFKKLLGTIMKTSNIQNQEDILLAVSSNVDELVSNYVSTSNDSSVSDFDKAYEVTIKHEGGYSNNPADVGGETYRGIARTYHPSWSGWKRIDEIKQQGRIPYNKVFPELELNVKHFYKEHFWDRIMGDQISSSFIAAELFDTAVNLGVSRAGNFLQTALNCLNNDQQYWNDLVVDGKIGPSTIQALQQCISRGDKEILYKMLNVLQGYHYIDFMRRSPVQQQFARGWFSRVVFLK